jgi:asparagine synthase (glutamine-hydrolysing)
MLTLHLTRDSANGFWRKTARGFVSGQGVVEPLDHSALETLAAATADELLVVVRERCATSAFAWSKNATLPVIGIGSSVEPCSRERLDQLQAEALVWPMQSNMVRIARVGDETAVTIHGGQWGTAPLFLVASSHEFWAHWNPSALMCRLGDRSLDWDMVSYFLATFGTPYSRRTMLRDMHLLTERATARWKSSATGEGELRLDYPDAIRREYPRTLKAGADVEATFLDIIASSTGRWLGPDVDATSELSGGLDSALVSCAAARLTGQGWKTCGLLLPPSHRLDQVERRRELVKRFGFADQTTNLADALPLASDEPRAAESEFVMPWEEIYYEATEGMLELVCSTGSNLLMTGFGGDELCTMNRDESAPSPDESDYVMPGFLTNEARCAAVEGASSVDRAPRGQTAASAMEAAAFSSAMYLRQGLWPVHPLCTPELVRFCAALPADWRANRTIERKALARVGCSPRITYGHSDNFAPALAHSFRTIARPKLEVLFHNSRVADAGYVNGGSLLRDFRLWADKADDADGAVPFYAVAMIELLLRSLDDETPNRRTWA